MPVFALSSFKGKFETNSKCVPIGCSSNLKDAGQFSFSIVLTPGNNYGFAINGVGNAHLHETAGGACSYGTDTDYNFSVSGYPDPESPDTPVPLYFRGTTLIHFSYNDSCGSKHYPNISVLPAIITYKIKLKDGSIADYKSVDSATISRLTIITGNRKPIADAGFNQQVEQGKNVTLDGSHSYDPDGDPITYV